MPFDRAGRDPSAPTTHGTASAPVADALDVGAERAQRRGEVGVAAVDVERIEHDGLAVGGEPREHQRGAGAHVERRAPARPTAASTPRTTACRPSWRMSAPMRLSSATKPSRLSNTFSVTMAVPSAVASSATASGMKSVAKPGNGSVATSTAGMRSSARASSPSGVGVICSPISPSFITTVSTWSSARAEQRGLAAGDADTP